MFESDFGSGPRVARLYVRLLAGVALLAWLSLASQVRVLIGSRGLVPVSEVFTKQAPFGFWEAPTLFWLDSTDAAVVGVAWLGVVISFVALAGVAPRRMLALSIPLYLSYATASRSFLAFQWDNLLLESLLLALFLPTDRKAPIAHLAFRILLFKLYFESGIAKYQSHLHDWTDGSAMTFYYETAPLPSPLAWYAHHLPRAWHNIESWATLVLEIGIACFAFGPRKLRLFAFVTLGLFQLVNLATANYGFFVYLALALHVFLLDDRDLVRLSLWARRARARLPPALRGRLRPKLGRATERRRVAIGLLTAYCLLSTAQGLHNFFRPARDSETVGWLAELGAPFRLINTYHLFGHITRERIEPEFQTYDGSRWTAQHFHHKPGPLERAPPFVAPHQPRVDFLLWFYGLGFRRMPDYVAGLLRRMCTDPHSVRVLFETPLPAHPTAVRIAFYEYHFTSPEEKRVSGAWWRRKEIYVMPLVPCVR